MFGLSANIKFYTFTADMFRYMCILPGCDYLSSIKAFADVKRNRGISATIRYFLTHRKLDLPVDYQTQVNRSLHCFKSQIVIDPLTLNQVLLHGNIDPRTGKFTQSFDISNLVLTVIVFLFQEQKLDWNNSAT